MWWLPLVLLVTAVDKASPPQALTLEEALRQAVDNQPMLASYRHETASAEARAVQARAIAYPQVAVAAQALGATGNSSPISYLSMTDFIRVGARPGGGGATSYAPALSALIGVGAHYDVLDFGYTRGSVAAAEASAVAADAYAQQALQDVLLRVSLAYFQGAAAEQTWAVTQESLKRAEQHRALAEAGVRAGLKPKIDLARSDAELAAAHLGVIRAQNNVALSRSALDTAIGWAPHAYTLAPHIPEDDTLSLSDDEAQALALHVRPDLVALTAEERAAEGRCEAASSGHYPRLLATGSVTLSGYDAWPKTLNWDAGLVLSVPIFNGFLIEGEQNEATARLGAVQARKHAVRDEIMDELRQAQSTLLASREAVQASGVQVSSTFANLNQAEARYKEGLGNIVELTDAQAQYADAQIGLVQSRLALAVSGVQLKHAYAGLHAP